MQIQSNTNSILNSFLRSVWNPMLRPVFRSAVDVLQLNYGLVIALITCLVINRCNHLFRFFPQLYPPNLRQSEDIYPKWKWRNFFISFIHSVITGFGALMCVLFSPTLLVEVIDGYLETAYIITCVSHGYFMYDLIEMLANLQYKGSKELVLHHIMVIICFSLTVIQHKYCGYSSIALIVELSNIFLHFRQLLIISNTSKDSTLYKINCYTNLVMFVLVRGLALGWLWVTLLWVLPKVPIIPKSIAFSTLVGICIMTYVLFVRVYKSDFSDKNYKNKSQTNGLTKPNQSNGSEQSNGLAFGSNDTNKHSKTS